jgi:hypothetical protein
MLGARTFSFAAAPQSIPRPTTGRGFPPLSPAWAAGHSAACARVESAMLWVDAYFRQTDTMRQIGFYSRTRED